MDVAVAKMMGDMIATTGGEGKKIAGGEGKTDFKKVMEEEVQRSKIEMKKLEEAFGLSTGTEPQFKTAPAEGITIDPAAVDSGKKTDPVHLLNEVNRSALQMDQLIEVASSGQKMNPQQLLAIQAGVLSISHEIGLTGQIVASLDRTRNTLFGLQLGS